MDEEDVLILAGVTVLLAAVAFGLEYGLGLVAEFGKERAEALGGVFAATVAAVVLGWLAVKLLRGRR